MQARILTLEEMIHITFHQLDHSPKLDRKIRMKAEKMLRAHPFILHCRIVVSLPHRHKLRRNLFEIRMDIKVPGTEIVINKQPGIKERPHEDPYVVINDAFKAAEHLLEKYKEKRHHMVKLHDPHLYGKLPKAD